MAFNSYTILALFQIYCCSQCTYPGFPLSSLTSTPYDILSKPLADFPHNHYQQNGQWLDKNESCCNDYHHFSEGILVKLEVWTSQSKGVLKFWTSWWIRHVSLWMIWELWPVYIHWHHSIDHRGISTMTTGQANTQLHKLLAAGQSNYTLTMPNWPQVVPLACMAICISYRTFILIVHLGIEQSELLG